MTDTPTLHLIDGHSLTFKAYYAVRGLTSPRGEPTGAVYGFLRMLLKFLDEERPTHLAVVFDTGQPTFREAIDPTYKANREAPPDDFEAQMARIDELLLAMGIRAFELEGYEADDLIGTMAEMVKRAGGRVVILSADKDLMQLVDDRVTLLRPGLNELKRIDPEGVRATLGVRPDQVVDWLALAGDSSDNIRGVPGIGEKTAAALLAEFGTLDALLARADEVAKPRLREALRAYADQARLARRLATIDRAVPLPWSLEDCRLPEDLFTPEACRLMAELGFGSILREHGLSPPPASVSTIPALSPAAPIAPASTDAIAPTSVQAELSTAAPPTRWRVLHRHDDLAQWVADAMGAAWLALDTETTGTDAMRAELVGIALACRPGEAVYVPVGHAPGMAGGEQMTLDAAREALRPLLDGRGPRLVGHHAKFDWKVLRRHGFEPVPPAFDTMIASYLLDPDRLGGHGLKQLGRELCGVAMASIDEVIGRGRDQVTMAEVPIDTAAPYACLDADVTLRLAETLRARLAAEPALQRLLDEVELPLAMVLLDMEMGGFNVDPAVLNELGAEVERELAKLARAIWDAAGHPFNIASPRQVADVLYGELGLKTGRQGKTGAYSTDEAELQRLIGAHPIVRLILEYRGLEKLKSTYIDALPKLVHPTTGRIHSSFNQTIAATGRLSSTDPNLQNIPIRTPMGRAIRRAFVPDRPDHAILKADYSQIELRILAHMSRDEQLCEAYRKGEDIHRRTAGEIFGVPPDAVTADMRAQAKVVNFGIIYGMSAHGLAQQLGISRTEAARFIDRYFQLYPGVRRWIDRTLDEARRRGYVETMLGRRRRLPDINAANRQVRANAERIAVNTPIQGTCADMIKLAMIRIHRGLNAVAPGARMVCQVHDELVFTVPRERLDAVGAFVEREMVGALPLDVPVAVELAHGPNWAEC